MSDFEDQRLLEVDIHNFLEVKIECLLGDGARVIGREYMLPFGRIDLLCQDRFGCTVVVEIKKGVADRSAVGQLLSYVGAIRESGDSAIVRGVLVAKDADDGCRAAMKAVKGISFFAYQTELSFAFNELTNQQSVVLDTEPEILIQDSLVKTSKRYCMFCKRETNGSSVDFSWRCGTCGNTI